jgi:hypothetical protein
MNLKSAFTVSVLVAILTFLATTRVDCDSSMPLAVCQELVSTARSYEARATFHNNVAKSLQTQITSLATFPKNQGTISAMDTLFSQYDTNRTMESKFRALYQQTTDAANACMKSAQ